MALVHRAEQEVAVRARIELTTIVTDVAVLDAAGTVEVVPFLTYVAHFISPNLLDDRSARVPLLPSVEFSIQISHTFTYDRVIDLVNHTPRLLLEILPEALFEFWFNTGASPKFGSLAFFRYRLIESTVIMEHC